MGMCGVAAAQAWPVKPVRVIAPFAAGGTADTLGRLVSGKLGESLGQQFVVENRAGAGGLVGSEIVSRSAPDGYTLGVSGVASHVVAPMLSKAPFDPLKDFTHIALFGGPPAVLALHPSLPAHDLKAFIALAKSQPAQLTYGSPGNGTHGHLIAELLKRSAGIDMRHVPYRGAAIAVVDVTAGHIHAISTTLSTAAPQIRAKRLRPLAASSSERLPDFPRIPTFRELGYSQLVATVWFGLSGPPGLSPEIVTRVGGEVQRALQASDTRERMRTDGVEPNPLDAKAFHAFIAAEIERWGPVVRASGARAD
jgi:tripartite-type tricarboxylate transporter receptor subunit TctC